MDRFQIQFLHQPAKVADPDLAIQPAPNACRSTDGVRRSRRLQGAVTVPLPAAVVACDHPLNDPPTSKSHCRCTLRFAPASIIAVRSDLARVPAFPAESRAPWSTARSCNAAHPAPTTAPKSCPCARTPRHPRPTTASSTAGSVRAHRLQLEPRRQLRHRPFAFQCFNRHLELERRRMPSSGTFLHRSHTPSLVSSRTERCS